MAKKIINNLYNIQEIVHRTITLIHGCVLVFLLTFLSNKKLFVIRVIFPFGVISANSFE